MLSCLIKQSKLLEKELNDIRVKVPYEKLLESSSLLPHYVHLFHHIHKFDTICNVIHHSNVFIHSV